MKCPNCGWKIESQQMRAARARWAKRGVEVVSVERRVEVGPVKEIAEASAIRPVEPGVVEVAPLLGPPRCPLCRCPPGERQKWVCMVPACRCHRGER